MNHLRCRPQRAEIDAHFEGTIHPDDERVMRAHLDGCAACRGYYRRRVLLASLDPDAVGTEERLGRALGLRAKGRPRRLIAAVALALAAAVLVLVTARGTSAPDGFATRGGAASAPQEPFATPRSHIEVYRVPLGGEPVRAGTTIDRTDELAFAYENGGGRKRLAIFGVDEHGHVYWFHPAWTNAAEPPTALVIRRDAGFHELPEAVSHPYDGKRLDVHAVFLDDAVSVRQLEADFAAGANMTQLDYIDDIHSFEVRR